MCELGDWGDVRRLGPLRALFLLERHACAVVERLEAAAGDVRVVDEEILRTLVRDDEAVPLRIVEPLTVPLAMKNTSLATSQTAGEAAMAQPDSLLVGDRGSGGSRLRARAWNLTRNLCSLAQIRAMRCGRARQTWPEAAEAPEGSSRLSDRASRPRKAHCLSGFTHRLSGRGFGERGWDMTRFLHWRKMTWVIAVWSGALLGWLLFGVLRTTDIAAGCVTDSAGVALNEITKQNCLDGGGNLVLKSVLLGGFLARRRRRPERDLVRDQAAVAPGLRDSPPPPPRGTARRDLACPAPGVPRYVAATDAATKGTWCGVKPCPRFRQQPYPRGRRHRRGAPLHRGRAAAPGRPRPARTTATPPGPWRIRDSTRQPCGMRRSMPPNTVVRLSRASGARVASAQVDGDSTEPGEHRASPERGSRGS